MPLIPSCRLCQGFVVTTTPSRVSNQTAAVYVAVAVVRPPKGVDLISMRTAIAEAALRSARRPLRP